MINSLNKLFNEEIWNLRKLDEKGFRGRFYAFLRICYITVNGVLKNKIMGQAAALSYSTLIALGPLIAIIVMISGFVLQGKYGEIQAEDLNKILSFISAPSAVEAGPARNISPSEKVNPEITKMFNHMITSAQSGALGVVGSVALIVIVIQLIITIENSMNTIWGVKQGRNPFLRMVYYWCIISLGTILVLSIITLLAGNAVSQFLDKLPFGGETLSTFFEIGAPAVAGIMIIGLLIAFYRFMPNTFVPWKAAICGALFAGFLLQVNHWLSFIYVSKVIQAQSLYGSIGVIPVLMFGLYVFWLLILLGGQITYAIQSVGFIASIKAWQNVSIHAKETVSLAAIMLIARRFDNCHEPYSLSNLSKHLRVPTKLLNECLGQLCKTGIINQIEQEEEIAREESSYQLGRPLAKITLADIKLTLENLGNNSGIHLIDDIDPIVANYSNWLKQAYNNDTTLKKNLQELIDTNSIK
jgi:membrane protein